MITLADYCWVKQTIKIVDQHARVLGNIPAETIKDLIAVHKLYSREGYKDGYAVTHINTGLQLVKVKSLEDAKRILVYLYENCNLTMLESKTKKDAVISAPWWARKWLQHCTYDGRWVDPPKDEE